MEMQDLLRQNMELHQQLLEVLGRSTNSSSSTPHFEKYIEGEDIEDFIDKYDVLVDIHKFSSAKKIATLVTLLPSNIFTLLKNLLHPKTFNTCSYDEIKEVLIKHMKPKPLIIPSRHTFLNRKQRENENISNYMTALRNLAIPCNYPEDQLKIMLRDVFVSGLHDKAMLDRLFEEDDADLDKVYKIALAIEKAQYSTQEILHKKFNNNVNEIKITKASKSAAEKRFNSGKGKPVQKSNSKIQCFRCGEYNHKATTCKRTDLTCFSCMKKGHVSKVCKSKTKMHSIEVADAIPLNTVTYNNEPFSISIQIEGKPVNMEIDTGSAKSILNFNTFRKISNKELHNTDVKFRTYDKSILVPLGVVNVTVFYNGKEVHLPLYIVDRNLSPILGREWIKALDIKWNDIKELKNTLQSTSENPNHELLRMLEEFKELFSETSGKAINYTAEITLKDNSIPVFKKARPVPYALRPLLEKELDRLEKENILKRVDYSDYATPIVPVKKADGKLRICADYSQTLNPQIQVPQYPVPRIEDLFSNLAKGKIFAKLDIRTAYLSLPVNEITSKLLTINTHKGLFQPLRLMYGINAAPAIWQKYIDKVLYSTAEDDVCVFYDDILIPAENENLLLKKLRKVFQLLQDNGLHLNLNKCKFLVKEVDYLGYTVSAEGVKKSHSKIKAIIDVQKPRTVKEVKHFLGMVTFYAKFFPQLASIAAPLYNLTRKNSRFHWSSECERSFNKIKAEITSDRILTHYDPEKPLILAVDAGPLGLGAVISHSFDNGLERPIAFASRTLNSSEKNYSQIDKEALAIKWGIEKFHFYLIGRKFTLYTDHQPLLHIFGSKSKLPRLCATRLLHYALFLQNFQFDIRYRKSEEHGNADCLSRLPNTSEQLMSSIDSVEAFQLDHMSMLPLNSKQISDATAKDRELQPLLEKLRNGTTVGANDRNFTLQSGCILYGLRVYIPRKFRESILQELHRGHLGIVKMKGLARSYVYWPKIDGEIEKLCKNCIECSKHKGSPRNNETHYWEYPAKPWERVHVDYADFGNRIYLLIVDAHSKWPEIFIVPNMNATTLINILDSLFARYGFPVTVVSDNQKTFLAESVDTFFKERGIRHITSPPYFAASNGQAERHVFNLKQSLRCLKIQNLSDQEALNTFLMSYRRAPHITTGYSPAFLFLKREIRTQINLSRPDIVEEVDAKRKKKITFCDHIYDVGQRVAVRNYSSPYKKWVFGTIVSQDGELQYTVAVQNQLWRRHSNQLRPVSQEIPLEPAIVSASLPTTTEPKQLTSETSNNPTTPKVTQNVPQKELTPPESDTPAIPSEEDSTTPGSRDLDKKLTSRLDVPISPGLPLAVTRPRRQIRPPKRLNL